jgi:hypothetical protein
MLQDVVVQFTPSFMLDTQRVYSLIFSSGSALRKKIVHGTWRILAHRRNSTFPKPFLVPDVSCG